jgi:hypothetical protein
VDTSDVVLIGGGFEMLRAVFANEGIDRPARFM